jgi:methionyl aminopeptidase
MRRAGLVVAEALAAVRESATPGVTTAQLDAVAAEVIADHHATGVVPGLPRISGPRSACRSTTRSCTASPGLACSNPVMSSRSTAARSSTGGTGDSAITVVLDGAAPEDVDLAATTERAMWSGIAALAGAERLGAVGEAVEDVVDAGR